MTDSIRYVSLKAHINGLPQESDFEFQEAPLPQPKEGQFIAENHYVSVDPGMRSRLSGVDSYVCSIEERHGIRNTTEIIGKRLMMQGLVVFDDIPQCFDAQKQMGTLILDGSLAYQEEIFEGLEALPTAFCGLFKGENFGRRLVKIA